MTKETGRNDPCPCGSGKKYKNCCMLKQENTAAKYTASGKRKIRAKILSVQDKTQNFFSSITAAPQAPPASDALDKLKFKMTKSDFRTEAPVENKEERASPSKEIPQERDMHLPSDHEPFRPSKEDFRKE